MLRQSIAGDASGGDSSDRSVSARPGAVVALHGALSSAIGDGRDGDAARLIEALGGDWDPNAHVRAAPGVEAGGAEPGGRGARALTTLLCVASEGGHPGIVRVLLGAGAAPSACAPDGRCPLHAASSLEVVRVLLGARADASVGDSRGRTPLHAAASREIAEALVVAGAPVNARDHAGSTPLHAACERGDAEAVPVLLRAGADVSAVDVAGRTPLHAAAAAGGSGVGAPAAGGVLGVIAALVEAGAAVDAADARGITPLFLAAKRGDAGAVAALLGAGGSVAARTAHGETVLHWVKGVAAARVLLGAGANPNSVDEQAQAPLHKAAADGDAATVAELLRAGADPSPRDSSGQTPLHWARSVPVALRLIEAGCDRDARDRDGRLARVLGDSALRPGATGARGGGAHRWGAEWPAARRQGHAPL